MPFHFTNKPTLVAYVNLAATPTSATTRNIVLATIEAGAGIVEFGRAVQRPAGGRSRDSKASERALKHGTSLEQVLKLAAKFENNRSVGLIVFSYLQSHSAKWDAEILQNSAPRWPRRCA